MVCRSVLVKLAGCWWPPFITFAIVFFCAEARIKPWNNNKNLVSRVEVFSAGKCVDTVVVHCQHVFLFYPCLCFWHCLLLLIVSYSLLPHFNFTHTVYALAFYFSFRTFVFLTMVVCFCVCGCEADGKDGGNTSPLHANFIDFVKSNSVIVLIFLHF